MSERVVVVSGATGGLGGAVVEAFRQEGDQVIGMGRKGSDMDADLTSSAAATAAISTILDRYKRLDVLVQVMGGYAGGAQVHETTDEVWNQMISMNLTAAFYMIRAALRPMIEARRGRIVAIGSRAGVVPAKGMSAYAVSKAGLNMLVRSAAEEVRDLGITVNALLPSTIDTPANRSWATPEQVAKFVAPQSIAKQIVWLASDEAADVSGALIPVYGRA